MALSAVSWDLNYCRIFTKQTECPSRLGDSECQESLRLETAWKHVSDHNQTFLISSSGPFCIQAMPSTSTICSMESRYGARSKQHIHRCNTAVLKQNFSIRYPPFSLISWILKKVCQEKIEQMIIVTPTWQTQPRCSLLLDMSMQCPLMLTWLPDLLLDLQGNNNPLVQNEKLKLQEIEIQMRWKEFQVMQPSLYPSQACTPVTKTEFYCKLLIGLE